MNGMNPKPFGGGDDPSLFPSLLEYLRPSTSSANSTINAESTGRTPPNEQTGLLADNMRPNIHRRDLNLSCEYDMPDESPEFLSRSIEQMELELRLIHVKPAYHVAMQRQHQSRQQDDQSCYLNDELRTSFLRAERYHPQKAAFRMVSFFEEKRRLFGDDVVGRSIRLTDLTRDDWASLQSGSLQFVSEMGGATASSNTAMNRRRRGILCYFPKHQLYASPDNMIRAWWYLVQSVLWGPDASTSTNYQKFGVAGVIYHVGGAGLLDVDKTMFWQGLCSLKQLPIRFDDGGIHYCFDDNMIRHAATLYHATYPYFHRTGKIGVDEDSEFHWHYGSFTECSYRLLQGGIPAHILPINEDGQMSRTGHLEWLNRRMALESGM